MSGIDKIAYKLTFIPPPPQTPNILQFIFIQKEKQMVMFILFYFIVC